MSPFRRCRFVDGILVAEKTNFIDGFLLASGLQPFHGNKILVLIGVISILMIKLPEFQYIHRQLFTFFSIYREAAGRLNSALHNTYTDVTRCRNFYPDTITRLELF